MDYEKKDFESLTDREIAELTLATNMIILRRIEAIHSYLEKKKGDEFMDFVNNTDYAQDFQKVIDYRNQINSEIYRDFKDKQ